MRPRAVLALTYLGAAVALFAVAQHWPLSRSAPVPQTLAVDVALTAFAAALIAFAGRTRIQGWAGWTPWLACGTMLGAMAMGPLLLAPWLVLAALAFSAAGFAAPVQNRRPLRRLTVVALAAVANFTLLCVLLLGDHGRADPGQFLSSNFRVHTLLSDVPLHDVWVFHLQGGGEHRTLADVQAVIAEGSPGDVNSTVAALVGLRLLLGNVLGWDDDKHFDPSASYVRRLSADDRARSLEEPGTRRGLFRTVYTFENEALAELMNATAHAFFCTALEPTEGGYDLYWAIYVKEIGPITKTYMALIDPFRRQLVYPSMVGRIERRWAERWAKAQ